MRDTNLKRAFVLLLLSLLLPAGSMAAPLKPRIVVLTDIAPNTVEPDDMESMIRLFACADLFEIEGLVATTGWSSSGNNEEWTNLIHDAINAYEKDLPNLRKRSKQEGHLTNESRQEIGYWPSPDYLRSVTVVGSQKRGMAFIGADNHSSGSELIIKAAGEADERPVWVQAWGGGNTLAQAIWQVQQTRSPEELKTFLRKLRVYTITDQDGAQKRGNVIDWPESSHQWMRREFAEDLFFLWDESAWKYQNGTGRSHWDQYAAHIQGHGHLGGMYPKYKYGVEGDTPAFLHVWPNGLNEPEHPGWGGWGGYFLRATGPDGTTTAYVNQPGTPASAVSRKHEARFYPAIFNDFAARMDWAKDGVGNRNPVVVVNGDSGLASITFTPAPGASVTLDASGSNDPDGDKLKFSWWVLSEAGTYAGDVKITGNDSDRATLEIPADSGGKSFHVVCEVTDNGAPSLTTYRRVIFEPAAKSAADSKPGTNTHRLRVIVTSDFPAFPVANSDPDDVQSMVRFLLYANEFDIEGLVASAGTFGMVAEKKNILAVLDEYDKVDEHLRKHDPKYPTADALRAVTFEGKGNNNGVKIQWGCGKQPADAIIGQGKDSEASNAIIAAADKPDPRPLYIGVWGGPREVAQAIWDVKHRRSEAELKAFVGKLRVFLIACQDATHEWLMDEFPDLFIIESQKTYLGMFGSDSRAWVEENIINHHGSLCAVYPPKAIAGPGVIEGDSPAFLYLVSANRGINDPEDPTQPSWGGQYVRRGSTRHYVDGPGAETIRKWRADFQGEFKERADWTLP